MKGPGRSMTLEEVQSHVGKEIGVSGAKMGVNHGYNRIRFMAPVASGFAAGSR